MSRRKSMDFAENKWLFDQLVKSWTESKKSKTKFLADLGFKPHSEINITHAFKGHRGFSFAIGVRIARALGLSVDNLETNEDLELKSKEQ